IESHPSLLFLLSSLSSFYFLFFFFNHTSTTDIYTLSLHDALPILREGLEVVGQAEVGKAAKRAFCALTDAGPVPLEGKTIAFSRSEEHTSELQSRGHLVCRLLLEKKKKKKPKKQILYQ